MDIEERKLRLIVRHAASLGAGRESILRKILIEQTPEPYKVRTGFVASDAGELQVSNQCDILVYNPTVSQPLYQIEEFTVVPRRAACLAIEVRSNLTAHTKNRPISGLDQMFKVWKSMTPLSRFPTQVFGFGYSGVAFDTFVQAVAARVDKDIFNVPECIVVHKKNYFCVRVSRRLTTPSPSLPDPRQCIAINFSGAGKKFQSAATAYFLFHYHQRIKGNEPFAVDFVAMQIRNWGLPDSAKRVIAADGTITTGPGCLLI
jgi:hypothetical protein